MDEAAISAYIRDTFAGVETVSEEGRTTFFRGPARGSPLAILVNRDSQTDRVSNLDRDGVFRLDFAVGEDSYRELIDEDSTNIYSGFNRIMPHPRPERAGWVCVVKPREETFCDTIAPLLAEAFASRTDAP